MPVKIAINGFGRIGRAALKIALEHENVQVVAINDLGDIANLAYLLKFDSVYGRFSRNVTVKENKLIIGNQEIIILRETEPGQLPWQDLAIDTVIESTGAFKKEEEFESHLTAGAKKVVISAPTDVEEIPTIVLGVNQADISGHNIVSCASCTTNSAAPVATVIDHAFGVKKALLTTVHAYTSSQSIIDTTADKDLRRGRAGAINISPSSTGAAKAAAKAYPALAGIFDGIALRVPLAIVSVTDFTFLLKKKTTIEEVNAALEDAADQEPLAGIMGVTSEAVVSSDFIGDPRSAIVDLGMTRLVDGNLLKVLAWYDNEWGYSNRLVETAVIIGQENN